MKRFIFIQSVSSREFIVGEAIFSKIISNATDVENIMVDSPYPVLSFEEMQKIIETIANEMTNSDKLFICIDAHANGSTIYFKATNSSDTSNVVWERFEEILNLLYNKFGKNALMIFVACCSASYFSTLESPHIPIIAAEGVINAWRAKKLLSVFYEELYNNSTIEQAYDAMIQEFPLEDEIKIEGNHKAVLKLFK